MVGFTILCTVGITKDSKIVKLFNPLSKHAILTTLDSRQEEGQTCEIIVQILLEQNTTIICQNGAKWNMTINSCTREETAMFSKSLPSIKANINRE